MSIMLLKLSTLVLWMALSVYSAKASAAEDQPEIATAKGNKDPIQEAYHQWIRRELNEGQYRKMTHEVANLLHDKDNYDQENRGMSGSGRVLIDIISEEKDPEKLTKVAQGYGCHVYAAVARIASASCPKAHVAALSLHPFVRFVRKIEATTESKTSAETKKAHRSLEIVGESVKGMFVDKARDQFGVDGSGLTICAISDSFDWTGNGSYQEDVESGDLPDDVLVLSDYECEEYCNPPIDEGRAMLQLVHNIAPGAKLAFHTGWYGIAYFYRAIEECAKIADIIVDDLAFTSSEPLYQDNDVNQLITRVTTEMGKPYFVSGGNYARNSWSGAFIDGGDGAPVFPGERLHLWKRAGATYKFQEIIVPSYTGRNRIVLYWDEPAFDISGGEGCTNDINLYLVSSQMTLVMRDITNNIGGNPGAVVSFDPRTGDTPQNQDGTYTYRLYITLASGSPPKHMQYIISVDDPFIYIPATYSGTAYGHKNAKGASTVGAIDFWESAGYGVDPPRHADFTSTAGASILFDIEGNRLSEPDRRIKPEFSASQQDSTTFFGGPIEYDEWPYHFSGTSAAAPNAAGVAALIMQASEYTLSPQEVQDIMKKTAIDMDNLYVGGWDDGYDIATGYGQVNASAAVAYAVEMSGGKKGGKKKKGKKGKKDE